MDEKSMDELRTKVASLKGEGTILKVSNLASKAFTIDVTATSIVTGNYGEQILIVGKVGLGTEIKMKEGEEVRLYLNNRRKETFETVFDGEREYAFVFGEAVTLKTGHVYIPLDMVA